MDIMMVVNLIHIISSVIWGGGAIIMAWFIVPAAKATGAEGQAFIRGLTQKTQFSFYMNISAWLAVITGTYMTWVFSGGFDLDWFSSAKGFSFTLGGLFAGVALTIAMVTQIPSAKRIAALGMEIQAGGGPPKPEQAEEMQNLQNKIITGGKWIAILLLISVVGMAIGRRLF